MVLEIIAAILARLQFCKVVDRHFSQQRTSGARATRVVVSIAPISASATVVPFTLASP